MSEHPVEFVASAASGKWITVDRDGEAVVKLAVPNTHLAQVLRLLLWTEVPLKVTVQPDVSGK